jgi:glycosyltransferase involved in cell wall biosynthesis
MSIVPTSVVVLIPAYRPTAQLISVIETLTATTIPAIVVVDDGSGPDYQHIFSTLCLNPKVTLLRHAINLGKGAALKTGMNHILCEWPATAGIVTADADGQHDPTDILKVATTLAENPGPLVLGTRELRGNVPWRSRLGNAATRASFALLAGRSIADTQTGLRGIPSSMVPHLLRLSSTGYEFELDMLLLAKHHGYLIHQVTIRTIYVAGNTSSHFNPIVDSMRVYFVLLRFTLSSLLTAFLDNVIFFFTFRSTASLVHSQVLARFAALVFNYIVCYKAVFMSRKAHWQVFPRYLSVVFAMGLLSYGLIRLLSESFGLPIFHAKLTAESLLFIANFAIQRDFVFTKSKSADTTDWDSYYLAVPPLARLTRKYTSRTLLAALRTVLAKQASPPAVIVELGGANSCFMDPILRTLSPTVYHVVDNNRYGLDLLRERSSRDQRIVLHHQDVLRLSLPVRADVAFSVGLIEHFDDRHTRLAVRAHFDLLRTGGYALISFPTPTLLYQACRFALELLGLWRFPDERPLDRTEVERAATDLGTVVFEKTLWPILLTQRMMIFRKTATP